MAAESKRAHSVREQSSAPDVPGFYSDPEDDMSGLAAWVDGDGRFFAVDDARRAREYSDDEALPGAPVPAAKPPRVVGATTNMETAAIALREKVLEPVVSSLRIFDSIPETWLGVIAVDGDGAAPLLRKGEVAVFETYEPHRHALVDGGLYVIEYQSTPGGTSREMWVRWFLEYRSRLIVSRRIVRVKRSAHDTEKWVVTPIHSGTVFGRKAFVCPDGPFDKIHLNEMLVGVVVGIYRGAAAPIGGAA